MKPIIFLDFDGVLHPRSGKRFSCIDNFENAVDGLDINIIFSTSWREHSSLDFLKHFFNKKIQSNIIGMTPVIKSEIKYVRFQEICQCLKNHKKETKWLAIDDDKSLFPENLDNLYVVENGLTLNDSTQLRKIIKSMIKAK